MTLAAALQPMYGLGALTVCPLPFGRLGRRTPPWGQCSSTERQREAAFPVAPVARVAAVSRVNLR
jgi:hypothetical protein